MDFANTFLRAPFYRTPPVAASVKAFTKIRLCHGCLLNIFAKYVSADGCFVKTIILLTSMIMTMLSVS